MKEKEPISKNDLVMSIATVVMAIATVVMMYTGWQQTKIAESLEKRARLDEEMKLTTAKRELQRSAVAALVQMSDQFNAETLKTKEDCAQAARVIATELDLKDNYFLLSHPEQAKHWLEIRSRFTLYWIPGFYKADFPIQVGGVFHRHSELTDNHVVEMFRGECRRSGNEFLDLYSSLGLAELFPSPKKE